MLITGCVCCGKGTVKGPSIGRGRNSRPASLEGKHLCPTCATCMKRVWWCANTNGGLLPLSPSPSSLFPVATQTTSEVCGVQFAFSCIERTLPGIVNEVASTEGVVATRCTQGVHTTPCSAQRLLCVCGGASGWLSGKVGWHPSGMGGKGTAHPPPGGVSSFPSRGAVCASASSGRCMMQYMRNSGKILAELVQS